MNKSTPDKSALTKLTLNKALPAFGARLRRLRRAYNVKQSHVAHMAGVNQATVSRWERGASTPEPELAAAVLRNLQPAHSNDSALRRLVECSTLTVHLITDTDHRLLAASSKRQAEWGVSLQTLMGQSVWAAASPAIQTAEQELESLGWWDTFHPDPVLIELDHYNNGFLPIVAGQMMWERVWLADGQPARLCTLS